MKKYILGLVFILGIFGCEKIVAQHSVVYEYDAGGNRISHNLIVMDVRRSAAQEQEAEPQTHTEKLAEFTAIIYPNPTEGLLKVELLNLPSETTAEIKVYDKAGKLLIQKPGISEVVEIDLQEYVSGIYVMQITAGESTSNWKIIKR
ncbi:T9SS C-terminal target domain-containing protein [Dysgonomonas sp. 216]|uniref:T9SS type A sorting domain-containing protein n=1 Tax=Dysgonomonas sp. 216 TaxID=2302934 RepID=UPI0013D17A99|nr:T9SS type A sorting domain-containing protein [Dysgonomonas sp. 216]NDW17682.1 T9SS C-terminal target domain-containing protein [Dysgonomonas sp. 216]